MDSRTYVRPSRASGFVLIVFGFLFLVFGVVLLLSAEGEAKPYAIMFLVIWVSVCLYMIGFGFYILRGKVPPAVLTLDTSAAPHGEENGSGIDFELKLKRLEKLRKENLITEDEYRHKREEIMNEKW